MIERIIYECEHCHKKRLINKTRMKEHEEICWYNPDNKTCITCLHNEFDGVVNNCILDNSKGDKPTIDCYKWVNKREYFENV